MVPEALNIGGVTTNFSTHTLGSDNQQVRLEPKAMALLSYLARYQGQVVSREDIEAEIWKDVVVGYDALNILVGKLRKAFDDDPKSPRIIETIPKVGYRLIAEIGPVEPAASLPGTQRRERAGQKGPGRVIALAGIVAGMVVVAVIFLWVSSGEKSDYPVRPTEPSLVVLPLKNISPDPGQESLSVAISEGITSGLSRFKDLFVISSDSANIYRDGTRAPQQIGRELGVRYLLTGNMQRAGDRLRINMQLVDSDTQSAVWAQNYDRIVNDIFLIQDEIIQSVTTALGEEIWRSAARGLDAKPVNDFASVDYLLKAKEAFHGLTRESTRRARDLIDKAINADPSLGRPYLLMAWTYYLEFRAQWQDTDPEALDKAMAYISQSEQKMGRTDEIHRLLAKINQVSGNFDKALVHSGQALKLNPNDGDLLATHAQMLTRAGDSEQAKHWIEEAMRRNPHYPPWYAAVLAIAQYLTGEYQQAVDVLNRSGDLPVWGLRYLIASYAQLGKPEQAAEPIEALLEQSPDFTVSGFATRVEFQLDSDKQHFLDGLRKAGLPE